MTAFADGFNAEAVRNPEDPLSGIERETLTDQLQAQREVLELEQHVLRRLMFAQPRLGVVQLGGGAANSASPIEQTIAGDERDGWNGVYVENPGPAAVALGFSAGGAQGAAGYLIPANTWKVLPVRHINLSVGLVDQAQAAGPFVRVTVAQLRMPPVGVSAGPLASHSLGGVDDTLTIAGFTAAAPPVATTIVQLGALTPGLYRVDLVTYQSTTPDANPANAVLVAGGAAPRLLPTTAAPIATPIARVLVTPTAPTLLVRTGGAGGGAGSIYFASMAATRLA